MQAKINSDGIWWFPTNESIKFDGTILFEHEKGGTLTLFGNSEDISDKNLSNKTNNVILIGKLFDDTKITLCIDHVLNISNFEDYRSGYSRSKFILSIRYIVLGVHFNSLEDINFEYVMIRYSNIDKWIHDYDIKGWDLLSKDDEQISFKYKFGKSIDVKVQQQNIMIQLKYLPNVSIKPQYDKTIVSLQIYIIIKPNKEKDIDEYIKLKQILQDFLNLISYENIIMESIDGYIQDDKNKHKLKRVELLYRNSISKDFNKTQVRKPFLFYYDDIANKFDTILNKWFELPKKLGIAYDLYFGQLYNDQLYDVNRFLMLAEALEVYHRVIFEGKSLSEKGDRSIQLKCRIQDIYNRYIDIFEFLSIKLYNFVDKISSYRNKLTHGNISSDEIDHEDIIWQYKNLQILFQLCLLTEIGFNDDEIKRIFFIDKLKNKPQQEISKP